MIWLSMIWNNPITRAIGGALIAAAGILVYGKAKERRGRLDERQDAEDADYEHAEDIRGRVERDLDERLRDFDDAGYRD